VAKPTVKQLAGRMDTTGGSSFVLNVATAPASGTTLLLAIYATNSGSVSSVSGLGATWSEVGFIEWSTSPTRRMALWRGANHGAVTGDITIKFNTSGNGAGASLASVADFTGLGTPASKFAAGTSLTGTEITIDVGAIGADSIVFGLLGQGADERWTPTQNCTELFDGVYTSPVSGLATIQRTDGGTTAGGQHTDGALLSTDAIFALEVKGTSGAAPQAVTAGLLTLAGAPQPATGTPSPATAPASLLPLTTAPVSASLSAPVAVPAGRLDLSTVPLVSTPGPGPAVAPANLLALTPALQPTTSAGSATSATAPLLVLGTAPLASAPVGSAPNIAATLQVVTVAILPAGASAGNLPQSVAAGLITLGLTPLSAGAAGAPLSALAGLLSIGTALHPASAAGAATAASAGLLSLGTAPLAGAPAGAPIATDTGFVSVLLGILAASATVEGAPAQPQSVVAGLLEIRLGLARIEERILLAIRTTTRRPSTRAISQRPLARSTSREPSPRAISPGPSAHSTSREPFDTRTEATT
jgi:hypothetical protein